jgi:hypothetical protein
VHVAHRRGLPDARPRRLLVSTVIGWDGAVIGTHLCSARRRRLLSCSEPCARTRAPIPVRHHICSTTRLLCRALHAMTMLRSRSACDALHLPRRCLPRLRHPQLLQRLVQTHPSPTCPSAAAESKPVPRCSDRSCRACADLAQEEGAILARYGRAFPEPRRLPRQHRHHWAG